MTLSACNNPVVLESSWYKTSVTLFHCWCLLSSLSKWTSCCDLDQCAVPPSSIYFPMSHSDRHWRANLKYAASGCYKSHSRTVVRECCKGDDASQWGNGKFDPSLILKLYLSLMTRRNMNTVYRLGDLTSKRYWLVGEGAEESYAFDDYRENG